jgi:hypothetical protein
LGVEPGSCCVQTGGDYAAVIEDEEVAILQKRREITEEIVLIFACDAVHDQHAAGAAN